MPMEEDLHSKGRKVRTPLAGTSQETGDSWSEREERVVDIYDSIDAHVTGPTAKQHEPKAQSTKKSETHTAPANPQNKNHLNTAAWCVALLCLLMLSGLTGLAVRYFTVTGQNEELQSALDNKVEERNRLQTAFNTSLKQQDALVKTLNGNLCTCWQNTSCSCYYKSHSTKNWNDSRNDCRERGSDLIVVNSKEEQDFVSSDFWLGLTDAEVEGTWKWVDGTPLTTEYWGTSQPDNKGIAPNTEEDCVVLQRTDGWNDVSCLNNLYWICEKKLDVSIV